MADFGGRWIGRLQGTNSGNFVLFVEQAGDALIWVEGVFEKLTSTLAQGRVRTGWLHSAHVYDALLFVIGMPTVLTLAAAASKNLIDIGVTDSTPYSVAAFLLVLYASLIVFRLGFSFVRWLLPYVAFFPSQPANAPTDPRRHCHGNGRRSHVSGGYGALGCLWLTASANDALERTGAASSELRAPAAEHER